MSKDHFIPRFIIRNFMDENEHIRFYNKESNIVSKEVPHYEQLQKWNFHSKKSLAELNELFPDIIINSIFKDHNKDLEKALADDVEAPMSVIIKNIIEKFNKREAISLTPQEQDFIRKYIVIQHLRTLKFKEISRAFNAKFSLPPYFKERVIENEDKREIDIKAIIRHRSPNLNHKARRELEMKWKKKLKKNPNLVKQIRQKLFDESLDEMVKNAEEEIKNIITHPERHSSNIANQKDMDNFIKRAEIDKKAVKIIGNDTKTSFVLGDTGIVIMADDPEGKTNLEIFLTIHPKILIGLSNTLPATSLIDDNFVSNFNRIAKEDSYKNVYSFSENVLRTLIN